MLTTFPFCLVGATLLLTQPALAGGSRPAPAAHPKPAAPATTPALAHSITAPTAVLVDTTSPESPRPVTLTGVVLRADGQPCPGATVYLAGAARDLVVTDARGTFRLPAGPAGKAVTVLAEYFGLGSTRQVVSLPASQPLRLTIGQ